jgi:hypothetical protein
MEVRDNINEDLIDHLAENNDQINENNLLGQGPNINDFEDNLNLEQMEINQPLFSKLTPRDVKEIVNDTIVSILFIIALSLPFYYSPSYCDLDVYLSMKTLIFMYAMFIFKALLKVYFIKFNKMNLVSCKIFSSISNIVIFSCYYICIFFAYLIYSKSTRQCLKRDTFTIISFFSIVFMGLISSLQAIINITILTIYFVLMVDTLINNPNFFFNHYGMDPEMIKNLPTVKADDKHVSTCIICLKDINEGDQIMILNCSDKHYFHGDCIKSWLSVKTVCPICRRELFL